MTIAAGFRFSDGILLCADTQHTSSSKANETKISQIKHGGASLVLVLAGRSAFARRGREKIEEEIKRLPQKQLAKGIIQDAIERALREVFNNHIYVHPDWGKADSPDFSFVIGLFSPIDGISLLATEETVCVERPKDVCLGSGSYLGDYLSRIYWNEHFSIIEAVHLAIYMLHQAKSYDANCGGESEFIVLWNDGTSVPVRGFDVNLGERYAVEFTQCVSLLFRTFADVETPKKDLKGLIRLCTGTLIRNLEDRKEKIEIAKKLSSDLGWEHYLQRSKREKI
jgi:20S proteasome alpha/beta subunit